MAPQRHRREKASILHIWPVDLTDTEHTRGAVLVAERGPEARLNMFGCVDAETVDVVFLYKGFNVSLQFLADDGMRGVQVGQREFGVAQPPKQRVPVFVQSTLL